MKTQILHNVEIEVIEDNFFKKNHDMKKIKIILKYRLNLLYP